MLDYRKMWFQLAAKGHKKYSPFPLQLYPKPAK